MHTYVLYVVNKLIGQQQQQQQQQDICRCTSTSEPKIFCTLPYYKRWNRVVPRLRILQSVFHLKDHFQAFVLICEKRKRKIHFPTSCTKGRDLTF